MLRKDYLVKRIEEFGKALALIMSKKQEKDFEAYEKGINEATKQFTGLDLDTTCRLSTEEFYNQVVTKDHLEFDQKKILGQLLFERMHYYGEVKEYQQFAELKEKNLILYTYLLENLGSSQYDLDIHYKLQHLKGL